MAASIVFVHVKNRDQETEDFHMYPAFSLLFGKKKSCFKYHCSTGSNWTTIHVTDFGWPLFFGGDVKFPSPTNFSLRVEETLVELEGSQTRRHCSELNCSMKQGEILNQIHPSRFLRNKEVDIRFQYPLLHTLFLKLSRRYGPAPEGGDTG
jgi:hypothetical protein